MTKKGTRADRKQLNQKSLGSIVASFAQELSRASLAADVMRLKMKNSYDKHDLLKQFDPAKIKIVTARISIPMAFTRQEEKEIIDTGVSKEQIEKMISSSVPPDVRQKVAYKIIQLLGKQNLLRDSALQTKIEKIVNRLRMAGFSGKTQMDYSKLKEYKNQWTDNLVANQEAQFVYKAEDLEKIRADNVVRFDITLDVS